MWEPRLLATLGASTACNRDLYLYIETAARELLKHESEFLGVHEFGWDKYGTEPSDDSMFFYGNCNENYEVW
jgi:hypothetical protein